jgi:purine nucleosidase
MYSLRLLGLCFCVITMGTFTFSEGPADTREKVIIDTDIGDAIDDAFAVALALKSPELNILGFTTAHGNPELRAELLDRLLSEAGRLEIPVAAGRPTHRSASEPFAEGAATSFTPRRFGETLKSLLNV